MKNTLYLFLVSSILLVACSNDTKELSSKETQLSNDVETLELLNERYQEQVNLNVSEKEFLLSSFPFVQNYMDYLKNHDFENLSANSKDILIEKNNELYISSNDLPFTFKESGEVLEKWIIRDYSLNEDSFTYLIGPVFKDENNEPIMEDRYFNITIEKSEDGFVVTNIEK